MNSTLYVMLAIAGSLAAGAGAALAVVAALGVGPGDRWGAALAVVAFYLALSGTFYLFDVCARGWIVWK